MTLSAPSILAACALTFFSVVANAQTTAPMPNDPAQGSSAPGVNWPTPAASDTTSGQSPASSETTALLKSPEIDQLVAPIALYSDPLLTNVLMASTYPLDVVAADRFLKANKNLKGDKLKQAVEKKGWDKSVAELTATPDVLATMSKQLEWTEKLGDAVIAQQADVMDAIQRLRARAQAANKLTTTKEQKVSTKRIADKDYIAIEPAQPQMAYVPYYDPAVVYGGWPYPDYPAYYWPPPYGWDYYGPGALAAGIAFGAYALAGWGNWWGGDWDWHNHDIHISRDDRDGRFDRDDNKWRNRDRVDHRGDRDRKRDAARNELRGRDGNRDNRAQAGNRDRQRDASNRGDRRQSAQNRGDRRQSAQNRGGNRQAAQNRARSGQRVAQHRGGQQRFAQHRGGQQRFAQRSRGGDFGRIHRGGGQAFAGHRGGGRSFMQGGGGRSFAAHGGFSRGGFGGGRGGMRGGGRGGGRR